MSTYFEAASVPSMCMALLKVDLLCDGLKVFKFKLLSYNFVLGLSVKSRCNAGLGRRASGNFNLLCSQNCATWSHSTHSVPLIMIPGSRKRKQRVPSAFLIELTSIKWLLE
jgi:hypothetical protein